MIYAPVLIPTCNRFDHFKQCIESLAQCTWAEYTDVFVAVDFPAKEEHKDGHKRITEYLHECGNMGFRTLNVTYRETNYYFSGKGNAASLRKEIFKNYDRIICSEDDNIFAKNFLVFLDKGLDKFVDDSSVLAINAYRHFYPIMFDSNTFFRQNVDFSAWGYGFLRTQYEKYVEKITPEYFRKLFNLRNILKVKKNGNNRLRDFINSSRSQKIQRTDNQLSVMMALENLDVVMPNESLVRNMGWDNTGMNCSSKDKILAEKHLYQKISKNTDFEFVGTGMEHYQENKKIYVNNSYGNFSLFKYLTDILKKKI